MEKYLVDFINKDGDLDCGIVHADNLNEAGLKSNTLVENNGCIVTSVMLWSDAVLATIDPDDYSEKGDR